VAISPTLPLRVTRAAVDLLHDGGNFILEAGTGTGKTVVACDAIASMGRKTLVIVPKEDLYEQWAKELKRFLVYKKKLFLNVDKQVNQLLLLHKCLSL